jgi:catechol 2,3-dioxygenase-like lactoylglutathione lyase family enzyme
MLTSFDHVTLVVNDVDAAVRSYESLLGSPASWRGRHPELGTHGALFALSNALVELVGPNGDASEADGLRARLLAGGEGMQAIAFGTADADACSADFRQRGLRATEPQPGEAHGREGGIRRYRTVDLSPRATRGLSVLAVERHGPKLTAELPPGAAMIDALDHVVIRTSDPEAAIALYGRGLGIRLALDRHVGEKRMLFFRVGGVTVEVVTDALAGAADVFGGVAFRVRDVDAAHARIRAAGFDTSEVRDGAKAGTRVFTVRGGTCGVPVLVLRDPARDGNAAV